jgi:hypothetical protein
MPIKTIDITTAPGYLIQLCAHCGLEHKINLDRGATETGQGPFTLASGDALELRIDSAASVETVTFDAADFPNLKAVTAAQLRDKVAGAVTGVQATLNRDGLVIESKTTGPDSRVEVVGGSARKVLGFSGDAPTTACCGRPVLGEKGPADPDGEPNCGIICLRRCPCDTQHTIFAKQRRAVNALAQYFRAQGWIHSAALDAVRQEQAVPGDLADLPSLKRLEVR